MIQREEPILVIDASETVTGGYIVTVTSEGKIIAARHMNEEELVHNWLSFELNKITAQN